jgi:hypothetical protein
MRSKGIKWGVLPLVAAALMACGGGGGGTSQPDVTPPATASISGMVAKGPAVGASVRLFNASGQQVGETVRSGADGRYTIVIPASEVGPFRLEADLSGATITSETGGTYTGAAGQILRAVVDRRMDTVHLTPFSDMAADLVGSGPLTPGAVRDANRKISQILNATDFLTSAPTEGNLLVALTAVQTLVDSNSNGLTAVLEQLRNAASSGTDGFVVSREFVQALQDACGTTTACTQSFNPAVAAEPVPVGQSDGIDAVRALFQDLRNTVLAFSNDQGSGELDQAGNRIDAALQAAVQPIDDEQIKLVALALDADQMLRAFQAGDTTQRRRDFGDAFGRVAITGFNGSPVPSGRLPQFRCEVSRATFTTTSGGQQDIQTSTATDSEVTPDNANAVSCFGVGTEGRLVPGRGDGFGYYHSLFLIPQAGGNYSYVHQVRRQTYDRTGLTSVPTSRVGAAVFGAMTTTRDAAGDMTGVALNGRLKPGFVGHEPGVYATLDRVDTTLNISTSLGTPTASLNVTGSMVLMKTDGTEASRVDITSGSFAGRTDLPRSYYDVVYVGDGSCPAGLAPAFGSMSPNLWCDGTVMGTTAGLGSMSLDVSVSAPGVRFQGNASADQPSFDSSQTVYLPTVITLRGRVSEADGASGYRVLLDGTATARLTGFSTHNATAGTQAPLQVSFDGRILLRNRPAMGFTFNGAQDAADNRSGTGSFFWNGRLLNFAAEPVTRSLVVSNDDGMTFTIPRDGGDQWQPIRRSGVLVGRINLDQQRIEYADGTFEQF